MKLIAFAVSVLSTMGVVSLASTGATPHRTLERAAVASDRTEDWDSDIFRAQYMDSRIARCDEASFTAAPLVPVETNGRQHYQCAVANIAYLQPSAGYTDTSISFNEGDGLDRRLELLGARNGTDRLPVRLARFGPGDYLPVRGTCIFRVNTPPDDALADGLEGLKALSNFLDRPRRELTSISCEIRDEEDRIIASILTIPLAADEARGRGGRIEFARHVALPQTAD